MTKEMHKKTHEAVLRLTVSAMLVALSVVFCRLLGYSPANSMWRVEIGFLPIAFIGMLYGPIWSAVGYTLSDLIGGAIFTGINPLITLCKFLFGFLLGLGLYNKKANTTVGQMAIRGSITLAVIGFFVDVLAMTAVFVQMGYTPSFSVGFADRGLNVLVNYPIRVGTLVLAFTFLRKLVYQYQKKEVLPS